MPGGSTLRRVTTDRVVETAVEIVDGRGLDALTLTAVAKALGVSQPAIYNHVDGMDDLLRRLALLARRRLAEQLRRAGVGAHREAAVRRVAAAWRGFVHDHPGLYATTDRHPVGRDDEQKAAVGEVVDVLYAVLDGYRLDEDARRGAAWSLRSAFHGFCVLEMEGGHPLPQDLDHGYERLVDLLCAGLDRLSKAAR